MQLRSPRTEQRKWRADEMSSDPLSRPVPPYNRARTPSPTTSQPRGRGHSHGDRCYARPRLRACCRTCAELGSFATWAPKLRRRPKTARLLRRPTRLHVSARERQSSNMHINIAMRVCVRRAGWKCCSSSHASVECSVIWLAHTRRRRQRRGASRLLVLKRSRLYVP
jgi:hypothetical protein